MSARGGMMVPRERVVLDAKAKGWEDKGDRAVVTIDVGDDNAEVIIIDPGRGHHGKFNQAMSKHGFCQETAWSDQQQIRATLKKGRILNYQRVAA